MADTHSDDFPHDLGHIVPVKTYTTIFGILLFLTIVTVWVAQFDFGVLNIFIAVAIATVKATLVAMFFMHLKYENSITYMYVFFPIFLLFLLIGLVFIDNPFRINAKTGQVGREGFVASEYEVKADHDKDTVDHSDGH